MITYVRLGHGGSATSANPRTFTCTTAPAASSQVVILPRCAGQTITSITDTRGNTYTADKAGGANRVHAWRTKQDVAPIQAGDVWTITYSGSTNFNAVAYEMIGAAANPLDQSAAASASASTGPLATGATGTTTQPDESALTALAVAVGQTSITYPAGYVQAGTLETNNGQCLAVAAKTLTAIGTENPAFSWGTAGNAGVLVVTYKVPVVPGSATWSAAATFAPNPRVVELAAATWSAPASFAAAGRVVEHAAATWSAAASLTVGGRVVEHATALWTAPASYDLAGHVVELAAATWSASAHLDADGLVLEHATATWSAAASLTVGGRVVELAAVLWTAPASLEVAAAVLEVAAASWSAPADWQAGSIVETTAAALWTALGIFTAAGAALRRGVLDLSGVRPRVTFAATVPAGQTLEADPRVTFSAGPISGGR